MSKIYPSDNKKGEPAPAPELELSVLLKKPLHLQRLILIPSVLTVWKRSSMSFHGTDGFMVFDHRGKLVFRVDNYTRHSWSAAGGGLLLLDAYGKALFTLKPQLMMGMQQQWKGYIGESNECSKVGFTMRRPKNSRKSSSCEAEVFYGLERKTLENSSCEPDLKSKGSFRNRNCKITATHNGELVAEVSSKRINSTLVLSDDVFTLTVQPGFDPAIVMAFVMILDRICPKPLSPVLCS